MCPQLLMGQLLTIKENRMAHIKIVDSSIDRNVLPVAAILGEFDADFFPQSNKSSIIYQGKEYDISHITFDYDNNVIEIIIIP